MSAGISWRTILLKMVSLMPAPSMLRINHVDSIQPLPAAERVCQRAAVDVFKLAAQGYAISQPGRSHAPCPRQLRQVVCHGVALHRGIGGNDQLLDLALAQALGQLGQTQLFRPQSVQRRQATHQHEILAAVTGGLLDRRQLGRRLHHAHHLTIAAAAGAKPGPSGACVCAAWGWASGPPSRPCEADRPLPPPWKAAWMPIPALTPRPRCKPGWNNAS